MTTPRLHSEIIADNERLWGALDTVILAACGYRKRRRAVIEHQARLKMLVGPEAWRQYLAVEAAANTQTDVAIMAMARWAFAEGVRYGG